MFPVSADQTLFQKGAKKELLKFPVYDQSENILQHSSVMRLHEAM